MRKHLYKKDHILFSDIIFQMLNESFNRLDKYVHGFEKEASILMEEASFNVD